MGLWSEWHYTTRELGGWIHNHERVARVIMYPYTNPRVVQCHSDHRPNAFSLSYHTFWCKFTHQHINLKLIYNVTLTSDCLSLALYDNGCSGVLNREHAQRLHVLPSPLLRHLQNAWAKSMRSIEMKSWAVTRVIMWHLCQHGVEASKDWVSVAHFSGINLIPTMYHIVDIHITSSLQMVIEGLTSGNGDLYDCLILHACLTDSGTYIIGRPRMALLISNTKTPRFQA